MFSSFSTALSALSAQSTAIDVVGNNLANLNTPGFKANVVAFHDLVTQSLGAGLGETQVGFGVSRPTTIREFTQGAIQSSSGSLDCAIQGDGFLMVLDKSGNTLFTRGGNLNVDKSGNLLTSTGERIQGWTQSGGVLTTNGPVSDIVVPVGNLKPPNPTSAFSWDANLDASAATGNKFSTSIEVFDSLGVSHVVSVTFTKDATPNQWDYSLSIPDKDVSSPIQPVTNTLTFDPTTGVLSDPLANGTMPTLSVPDNTFVDGAAGLNMTWQLWDGTRSRLTQFAQPSATSANAQDGYAAAQLVKVGIGDGGQVLAQYSNGKQDVVAQLAMAAVRNPESMIAAGNNNFQLSSKTALPALGLPGTGGRGSILGSSIEYSTVDIAREFTNLIVYQRGYEANAKVVTAVDELSTATINLKR